MATHEEVTAGLSTGSYEQVGDRLGIPAGQAYLIPTGRPADGSHALGPEILAAKVDLLLEGPTQHFVNPAAGSRRNRRASRAGA